MAEILAQLKALEPTFAELLTINGAPGLSLGVLYHGKIIHTAHFGEQASLDPTPPNDDTIYRAISLTKALTSSAVALLVEEGMLDWDVPIQEYLPVFSRRTDDVGQKTTLRDLLCHRTGLPNADFLFEQQYGTFLMPRSEIVRLTTFLEAVRPLREKFRYSQWNYGLVTEVVEAVTDTTLGSYIKDTILDPLSMGRTTLGTLDDENVAVGHAIRNNGNPCKTVFPNMERWCWSCCRVCVQIECQRSSSAIPRPSKSQARPGRNEAEPHAWPAIYAYQHNILPSHRRRY